MPTSFNRRVLGFGMVAALAAILCVSAAPPPALLEQLNSEDYPDRVEAETALLEWAINGGREARTWLQNEALLSEEPEIRLRSRAVLKELVLGALWESRPGFVGISMTAVVIPEEAGGGFGVRVNSVTVDSPAEEAGLQVGDVLTGLDGEVLRQRDSIGEFAGRIGAKRAGDLVQIEFLRKGEKFEKEVKLAGRPWELKTFDSQRERLFTERFDVGGPAGDEARKEAREEVFENWLREQKGREQIEPEQQEPSKGPMAPPPASGLSQPSEKGSD